MVRPVPEGDHCTRTAVLRPCRRISSGPSPLGSLAAIWLHWPLGRISLTQNARKLGDERWSFWTDFGLLVTGGATRHVLSHNSGASPKAPGRRHHARSETISRQDDCSLWTVGGQSRAGRLARSLGDQRESQTLYHWAEIVEIDDAELLIIRKCCLSRVPQRWPASRLFLAGPLMGNSAADMRRSCKRRNAPPRLLETLLGPRREIVFQSLALWSLFFPPMKLASVWATSMLTERHG